MSVVVNYSYLIFLHPKFSAGGRNMIVYIAASQYPEHCDRFSRDTIMSFSTKWVICNGKYTQMTLFILSMK